MPSKKGAKWAKNPEDSILRWEYYKKQDPSRTQEECEILAMKRRKARNKGSVEYYELHYPDLSHEEHIRMLAEYLENYKKNQPTHIEYWINKYPDLPTNEQERLFHDYMRSTNGGCIEFYERKYPDKTPEERQRMLEDWLKKHQASQPKLVGDKNPGHSKNTTELERKQRSPKCIEFYELRYPDLSHEDHLRMLNEHKSNVTKILQDPKNQVLCVEHWLDKGYSIEEAEQKLNEEYQKRSFTLEKCIKKYGEEEGRKKFEERQIKWQKSLKKHFEYYGDGRSPQSEFAIYLIGRIYRSLKLRKPLTEKYITDKTTKRSYAYDFCYKNIIIEFNGDYWHMNPAKYKADDINRTTKQRAADKWNEDAYKKALAEKYGYKVLVIWESEFNKSMKETLDKCLSFIRDNVSN